MALPWRGEPPPRLTSASCSTPPSASVGASVGASVARIPLPGPARAPAAQGGARGACAAPLRSLDGGQGAWSIKRAAQGGGARGASAARLRALGGGEGAGSRQGTKRALLDAIESGGGDAKARIIELATALETSQGSLSPDAALINGKWCLVYSTKAGSGAEGGEGFINRATGELYKIFFKFAPFLAGSEERKRGGGGGAGAGGGPKVRNEQTVNLGSGKVFNLVEIDTPLGKLPITVRGEVAARPAAREGGAELSVVFTDWSLGRVNLPLPRPEGSLTVTYCDEDLRVSRGGRGGLFITTRM